MLTSQLDTSEALEVDEHGKQLDLSMPVEEIVSKALKAPGEILIEPI